ncbi:MAG: long-chain fatty acid--CoA ligase [Bacteroidales bacterium]
MANKLVEMIASQTSRYGDREAFRFKKNNRGGWISASWNYFKDRVESVAYAMQQLGIEEDEKIGIFSQNHPDIFAADFAAFYNRALPVPFYATSSKALVEYVVRDASIKIIFVGDQGQYSIARELQLDSTNSLESIVALSDEITFDAKDKDSKYFESLVEMGKSATVECKAEVARRSAAGCEEDLATLIYTSGTTGESKGVMLTHKNFDTAMRIHEVRLTMLSDKDLSIAFLPLSHIFEKAWSYYCLTMGMRVAINYDPKQIQEALLEVKPTIMCSVPRFWEKVYAGVQEKIASMGAVQRILVKRALKVGAKRNLEYERVGKRAPKWLEMQYQFFDKKVFKALRKALGLENGILFPTAGAAISDNITTFLHSCGINIVVGYGLTETTATVSCFPITDFAVGTIGTVFPELEAKIGENNEILVKGGTVMKGYYNKPEATAQVFTADGWFRTGDAGAIAEDGALIITDRIKDLFKTSNGKYIAPQAIENRLGEDKFIEQIAVIGDQRKYVTAIIIPAYEALKEWAEAKKIQYDSVEELVKHSEVYQMLEERINALQHNFSGFEKVKKFTLLPKPFSMETGELTNTLKLRRMIINKLYSQEIEAMYI